MGVAVACGLTRRHAGCPVARTPCGPQMVPEHARRHRMPQSVIAYKLACGEQLRVSTRTPRVVVDVDDIGVPNVWWRRPGAVSLGPLQCGRRPTEGPSRAGIRGRTRVAPGPQNRACR